MSKLFLSSASRISNPLNTRLLVTQTYPKHILKSTVYTRTFQTTTAKMVRGI